MLKVKSEEGEAVIAETSAILRYLETVVGRELVVDPSKEVRSTRCDQGQSVAPTAFVVFLTAAEPARPSSHRHGPLCRAL